MQETPIHGGFNPDLLELMPENATRVVEVGCSSGALAAAYLEHNAGTEYIGIEREERYAEVARGSCSRVLVGDIEHMDDGVFSTLFPSSCWVFGDVLEHLYDPWAVLRRLRGALSPEASVVACIPNSQHWSFQAKLNSGVFRYEDSGLLDRTHIRWFTRITMDELFESTGFRIVDDIPRIFDEPERERYLAGVRAFAQATGTNVDHAVSDAIPLQWVIRAMPAGAGLPR